MPRDVLRETWLGFVRVHLLHHAAREPIHGLAMMDELRRHGDAIGPGTLYPMLHAMEAAGLLRSARQLHAGRWRRRYRATAAGRAALRRLQARLRELVAEVLEAPAG